MDGATRELVRQRAGDRCEYCLLPQEASLLLKFHIDHVIARQHLDGEIDDPKALALACNRCSAYKGTNLTSIDPTTKETVSLFNPRQDTWQDHFRLDGREITGLTATGRATTRLLNIWCKDFRSAVQS